MVDHRGVDHDGVDQGEGPDTDGVRAFPGGVRLKINSDGPEATRSATVWLARPEVKNAQSFATWRSLARVADMLSTLDLQLVWLRSEGTDFSAGLDLRMMAPGGLPGEGAVADLAGDAEHPVSDSEREQRIAEFQEAFTCWRDLDALVIAVVQGRAIGAGFQLALAADLRIATTDAVFIMAEVKLGLVPDLGGTGRLLELIGYSRTLELCATARPLPAAEALAWGVVNTVVEADQLDDHLQGFAAELQPFPTSVTHAVKRLVAGPRSTFDEQLAAERTAQAVRLRGISISR